MNPWIYTSLPVLPPYPFPALDVACDIDMTGAVMTTNNTPEGIYF